MVSHYSHKKCKHKRIRKGKLGNSTGFSRVFLINTINFLVFKKRKNVNYVEYYYILLVFSYKEGRQNLNAEYMCRNRYWV